MKICHFTVVRLVVLYVSMLLISMCIYPLKGWSQNLSSYHGYVVDSSGHPLANALIQVKESNRSAFSNDSGRFTVTAVAGQTLQVSLTGFLTAETELTSSDAEVNIKLFLKTLDLEDVIVVGYGTQKRAAVTGAVSTIKGDALMRTPSSTISAALVGKVPGISARAADARPGKGTSISIRNLGDPLFVIDGIPYGGNTGTDAFGQTSGSGQDVFNQLGPDDIESISILKDASASIYGLRASNGVVLVTTKKGKSGDKAQINMTGYYGLQNFTRYPKPATAAEYVRGLVESEQNKGNDPSLLYTKDEYAKWQAGTEKGYKSYDYYDMIIRPNVPQYFGSISASGGSQKTTYYMSLSHLSQDATIKGFKFERTNLQSNIESTIANGLKVGMQISGRIEKRHNVGVPGLDDYFNPFLSILSMWPTESPYANDNPDYINQTHNVNVNPATYKEEITGYTDDIWRAINVNSYAQYNFKFGLQLKGTYSYNYMNEDFDGFEYTWDAYKYNSNTDAYETEPGFGNQNPWREKHKRNVVQRYMQLQINYNKTLGSHNFSALAGYERSDYDNSYLVIHSIPSNNYIPLMSFSEQDYLGDTWSVEARAGYIGKFNYNYKQKYLVEFLGRYDGSYLYASNRRWGFFPGVSLGWRISQESFLKDKFSALTDLKIRASYGETGSELGINPFGYLDGYTYPIGSAVLDGNYVIGSQWRGLAVTNLSWVVNKTSNIGVDFNLWNGSLTGQFDVFERRRSGLPLAKYDVLLPSEVGYSLPNENLGSDATRGFDGMVTYNNSVGKVDYSIGMNATYGRIKTINTYKPRFGNSWEEYRNSIEHRWLNTTWGYQVSGRFQSEEDISTYAIDNDGQGNRTELPGDFKYKDVNGDGIINGMDQRPIGYAQGALPYLSFGINGSLAYAGFSLKFDFAGATMQTFMRDWELRYPFQNNGNSPSYMLTDRWHREDPYDPNSKWIPGLYPAIRKDNTTHVNYANNDFWITNVKYIRLKNLELGYNFPMKMIQKWGLSAFRIYVNGTNLFSFDNVGKYGIDPEIGSTNGLVYPQQRLYNFGFNLSL